MKDKLSICPRCTSDACYITPLNEVKNNYFCFGCGFQTNDLMKEGEFDFETYEDRVKPSFGVSQFDNVEAGGQYLPDEPNGI